MDQALLQLAIFAAEQLIKQAPALYADFAALVSRDSVTLSDLQSERMRVAALSYEQLVPNTKLPKDS